MIKNRMFWYNFVSTRIFPKSNDQAEHLIGPFGYLESISAIVNNYDFGRDA